MLEKCDFEAQEACILKLLRKKRYRGQAGVHLGLLQTSLILGKYGQSRQELEELYRLRGRLNRKQMLQLYLFHIDHMLSVNEPAQLKSVAEAAESELDRLGRLKDRERKKIQAGIRLRRYLAEQKWEEALASLEDIKCLSKNTTVFEQMSTAYVRGRCCYQLTRYKEACEALNFAAKWGGNTKYVALAKDMLQKIGQQNLCSTGSAARPKKIRHQMGQKGLLLAIDGIFIVLFGVLSVLCSRGGSVEEAYGRRYLCDRSGLTVLYRESIDLYELAVLMDGDRISYCLLSKEPGSSYRVRDSFCMDMSFWDNARVMAGTEQALYEQGIAKLEMEMLMAEFYGENEVFYREDMEYVGLSYFDKTKDMTVNGKPVEIKQTIYLDGTPAYLWGVTGIDLEEAVFVGE